MEKEGERVRREKRKRYLRQEDFVNLHMEPYNQKEAAKISVDISGGKGKNKVFTSCSRKLHITGGLYLVSWS